MQPHYIVGPLPHMTASEKFATNLDAIRVVQRLRDEGDEPTASERATLAKYTGWGNTSVRRLGIKTWGEVYGDMADLGLSGDELRAIKKSTLNAHYTDVRICRIMWAMLAHMGLADLKAPRILEPSVGVGHFLGTAPIDATDIIPEHMVGVELDSLTAEIATALYPRCDIHQGGFEQLAPSFPSSFDVVIGNVPFGDYAVHEPGGTLPSPVYQQIHDYFVCRAVSLLRPGGVACLITGKGTLDKEGRAARLWLAEHADLVAAFRLPDDAFEECAGTQVTTDVLIFRRLEHDRAVSPTSDDCPEWIHRASVDFPGRYGGTLSDGVNAYWIAHPDHVLGQWCQNRLVMQPDAGVTRRPDDPPAHEMLARMIGRLPAGSLRPQKRAQEARRAPQATMEAPTLNSPQELALGRVLRATRRVIVG